MSVQKGLNLGVILFIVSEALFFVAIFWAFFHKLSTLWIETKFQGSPKALITKLLEKRLVVAQLITEGIVTSLEILAIGMGNRGSKSDSHISVKEQRADGFSILYKYCKVCSKCQGNLVLLQPNRGINSKFKYSYSQSSLFSTSSNYLTKDLNPNYVTGFSDGESCFFIGVSPDSSYKTNFRVKATFQIGVHEKDESLLKKIQLFFGVGLISRLGQNSVQYRVSKLEDLSIILNHFENYPLITHKQADFLLFKETVCLMREGKHLTKEGLNRVVSIKATINNGNISDSLSLAFPDINPASRPNIQAKIIKDLDWLAGFTDAEGCFFIALKKSAESKLGETVWLKFILTQHTRDRELLESLKSTLNCGRYISKSGYGEFVVEKFSDIRDKIIPVFEEFKLHGLKLKNFEDFKKAAVIINSKNHLTREGLDEVKKIKGRMNKSRK